MAIYHFSAKMISRSSGRSATAAAAYRAAERIMDHRQGLVHDYSKRSGVVHSEVLAPEGTPALRGREGLWNAVEATERRKDAQVAREVTFGPCPTSLQAISGRLWCAASSKIPLLIGG